MTIDATTLWTDIQNNGNKYTRSYTKQVREADDDVEDFQDNLVEFKKIVRQIHNYSSNDTTSDKLKSYLSDLADTYNTLVKNKSSLTDSSLNKQLDKLSSLIDDNAKSLKKLGLKKDDDGNLEFDEDTFDDNLTDNKKTIKKLFEGTDSFGDQLFKITRSVESSADDAQYITSERYLSSTTQYTDADILKAGIYLLEQQEASLLNSYAEYNNNGYTIDFTNNQVKNNVSSALGYIVAGLNSSSSKDKILESYESNKDNLDKIGFTYDESTGKFSSSYTVQDDIDTDAFKDLFNSGNGSFYNAIVEHSKESYNDVMKTDTIGVTIDTYI